MRTRARYLPPWAGAALALSAALAFGGVAALSGQESTQLAYAACLLPLVPVLWLRPEWGAVAAVALLPFELNVAGTAALGLNVAPSDVLLALAFAATVVGYVRHRDARIDLAALRPLVVPFAVYLLVAVVVIAAHPSARGVVRLVQRVEVVGVATLVGACVLTFAGARRAWSLFLASALVLSLLWLANNGEPVLLGGQKNPSGQFIADAALISLVLVRGPLRVPVCGVFVAGVFATESRGALLGVLAGLVVLVVLRSDSPAQVLVRLGLVALVFAGIYQVLPEAEQRRLVGDTESVRYSDHIRSVYTRDARRVIVANPLLGVGIGNYEEGKQEDLTRTDDPHNVLLLEAAEGGFLLLGAFVFLHLGVAVIVFRRRRTSVWAPLALAVEVSILTHSVVDVYWVRGTPVAAWVLVGLTLAAAYVPSQRPNRMAVALG